MALRDDDREILRRQLAREPRRVTRVAARCAHGCPQVIETSPFIEGDTPFPTLYWLTCPKSVHAVSRLEDEGWSERLQERLVGDELLKKRLHRAHVRYMQERQEAGDGRDHPALATGVAGVRNFKAVKCLHAHYAHYLATGENPIGEIVHRELAESACERCDAR